MRSALFTTKQRQSMKMADIQSPWMKSGIQALEHKYPDKPVTPGKAAHMEFEYIRHGTVSLIGFFDVATRHMEKPYLNSTRTEKDFVEAIRALIETDPEAPWTFVCDGLNLSLIHI